MSQTAGFISDEDADKIDPPKPQGFISDEDADKASAEPFRGFLPDHKTAGPGPDFAIGGTVPVWQNTKDDLDSVFAGGSQIGRGVPGAGLVAKAGYGAAALASAATPDAMLPEHFKNMSVGQFYDYYKQMDEESQAKIKREHPVAAQIGELGGALATPMPGAKITELGPMVGTGLPIAAKGLGAAGVATRVLGTAGIAAADQGTRNPDKVFDTDRALEAGEWGGGIAAGLEALPVVGKVAKFGSKKIARALTNVSEEGMERYAENPEAINLAGERYNSDPSVLKGEIDSTIAPVNAAVDDAAAAHGAAREKLGDAKRTAYDARRIAAEAERDAYRAAKEGLDKTGAPEGMATDIVQNLDQQSTKLSEMSGESFDILESEGHTFRTEHMEEAVDKQMESLLIGGIAPKVGPDAAAYAALGKFKGMISEMGENAVQTTGDTEVPAGVVKRLIQTLDATSKAAYGTAAGELGPEAAVNLAQVRGSLNKALRNASEAYASKMDELAPQVRLVSDMSKVFGDEKKAMMALNAAGQPTPQGYVVRQMLERYDTANGTTFTDQMKDFFAARETLQSPTKMQAFREALPEAQTAAGVLPEEAAVGAAQGELDTAANSLEDKRAWAEGVSKLGPNSTETAIKTVQGGRGSEIQKQLQHVDETYNTNHLQNIRDAGLAKQFDRPTEKTGRKATAGAAIGSGFGATIGSHFGPTGATVGATIGAGIGGGLGMLTDVYGGQVVKLTIDAGINIKALANTPYIAPIMEAAAQGNKKLAITHYIMCQTDPKYCEAAKSTDGKP